VCVCSETPRASDKRLEEAVLHYGLDFFSALRRLTERRTWPGVSLPISFRCIALALTVLTVLSTRAGLVSMTSFHTWEWWCSETLMVTHDSGLDAFKSDPTRSDEE
jgi:hypothetical protein